MKFLQSSKQDLVLKDEPEWKKEEMIAEKVEKIVSFAMTFISDIRKPIVLKAMWERINEGNNEREEMKDEEKVTDERLKFVLELLHGRSIDIQDINESLWQKISIANLELTKNSS